MLFERELIEFAYDSETNGDGAEMFKLEQACPNLNIYACTDAQPRPHWFQRVPVSGVLTRNLIGRA